MKEKKTNKKKTAAVRIDNSLEKFNRQPIFQDKVDKANEVLKIVGLPSTKKR